MRRGIPFLAALLLAAPGAAWAHAHLTSAVPPVGGSVASAPAEVILTFSEAVEPAFSTIEVRDAAGNRVDAADRRASPDDPKRLVVGLKPVSPGTYKVIWRVTSTDTHKTEGGFTFTIAP